MRRFSELIICSWFAVIRGSGDNLREQHEEQDEERDASADDGDDDDEEEDEDDGISSSGFVVSMVSATLAKSGRFWRNAFIHIREKRGRARAVLCHTIGKFVELGRFLDATVK